MVNPIGCLTIFNFVIQSGKEQTVGNVDGVRWIDNLYD